MHNPADEVFTSVTTDILTVNNQFNVNSLVVDSISISNPTGLNSDTLDGFHASDFISSIESARIKIAETAPLSPQNGDIWMV